MRESGMSAYEIMLSESQERMLMVLKPDREAMARKIFDKVAATLPDELARDLTTLGPRFLYIPDGGIKSYAKHADVVDELLTGALRRQTLDARYTPAHGKKIAGGFEPWGIALYRNGLYAVGRVGDGDRPARVRGRAVRVGRAASASALRGTGRLLARRLLLGRVRRVS